MRNLNQKTQTNNLNMTVGMPVEFLLGGAGCEHPEKLTYFKLRSLEKF